MKEKTIARIMAAAVGAVGLLMLLDGNEAEGLDVVTIQKIAGAGLLLLAARLGALASKAGKEEER